MATGVGLWFGTEDVTTGDDDLIIDKVVTNLQLYLHKSYDLSYWLPAWIM